ncbi:MAG TPA: Clp protease N-terminal domain-containing protein [Acidimicrobiales bacterium]|nr:Clp protease N-terminal domain-containing protein [Acidimicrobiales bacterium]
MDIELDRLIDTIADASDDPLERVASAVLVQDQLAQVGDDLLDHFVTGAREDGYSWAQIGEALGVTRQAAQQRHGGLVDRLLSGLLSGGRFRRFAPRARTAVTEAQVAARARNHAHIGTEHVLVGLFAAGDGNLASLALGRLGLDKATVERMVDERVPPGDKPVTGHLKFTPNAKRTLELSVKEALGMGHNYIGTEHIVLALRQVEDGHAAQVMDAAGITLDALRDQVLAAVAEATGGAA